MLDITYVETISQLSQPFNCRGIFSYNSNVPEEKFVTHLCVSVSDWIPTYCRLLPNQHVGCPGDTQPQCADELELDQVSVVFDQAIYAQAQAIRWQNEIYRDRLEEESKANNWRSSPRKPWMAQNG